ncbi:MAG: hypothetical protein WCH43_09515, partial [Verrucomicrobiota bacterium]
MNNTINPGSPLAWKTNWPETRQRFVNWWGRKGCLVGGWFVSPKNDACHAPVAPVDCPSNGERYTNPALRAQVNHAELSRRHFPGDFIP